MYEKAQKKHKNYLRRQRAKQAKNAQKERDSVFQKPEFNEPQTITKTADKCDTFSLAGSDSGVSVKSANSIKNQTVKKNSQKNNQKNSQKNNQNNQKTTKTQQKIKTIQKVTVFKNQTTPERSCTPEFNVRQPMFANSMRSNFQNQGKLRASTDDKIVSGEGSSSAVFAAKPVNEPRTWSNSRLHKRQPRGRVGSRS